MQNKKLPTLFFSQSCCLEAASLSDADINKGLLPYTTVNKSVAALSCDCTTCAPAWVTARPCLKNETKQENKFLAELTSSVSVGVPMRGQMLGLQENSRDNLQLPILLREKFFPALYGSSSYFLTIAWYCHAFLF